MASCSSQQARLKLISHCNSHIFPFLFNFFQIQCYRGQNYLRARNSLAPIACETAPLRSLKSTPRCYFFTLKWPEFPTYVPIMCMVVLSNRRNFGLKAANGLFVLYFTLDCYVTGLLLYSNAWLFQV